MRSQFRTLALCTSLLWGSSCAEGPPELLRPPPLVIYGRLPGPIQSPARVVAPLPDDGRARLLRAQADREREQAEAFPLYGVAFHVLSQVQAKPARGSAVIGYMRRGARFRASKAALARKRGSCRGGRWYALKQGGFICSGRGFLVGATPQHFEPSPAAPSLQADLPYLYMKTIGRNELQYWRTPSAQDVKQAAVGLEALRARQARPPAPAVPDPITGEVPEPPRILPDFVRMAMEPGFYVSIDGRPAADGDGEYLRTVRGAHVRAAGMQPAKLPEMRGAVLGPATQLPLAFVFLERARHYHRATAGGEIVRGDHVAKYTTVTVSDQSARDERRRYVVDRRGGLLSRAAVRIARATRRPAQVPRGARWVHVRLSEQVLVAYEGDTPVYATLVSTGKEGFATPTGLFRIHAKHVSTTMDGAEGTDEVYSIEDVPWTMYFDGSIALHAAFWHDRFGRVRSHGCVNLAPPDAHWLFQWSTPALPRGLHGVMPQLSDPSTYVVIED